MGREINIFSVGRNDFYVLPAFAASVPHPLNITHNSPILLIILILKNFQKACRILLIQPFIFGCTSTFCNCPAKICEVIYCVPVKFSTIYPASVTSVLTYALLILRRAQLYSSLTRCDSFFPQILPYRSRLFCRWCQMQIFSNMKEFGLDVLYSPE